jgi:hypothetical protein
VSGAELIVWALAAGAVWSAGYVGACAWWPFGACRKCGGSGSKPSPSGKYWRPCRRCRGTGRRVRLGRRVWEKLVKVKDKAVG